MSNWLVFALAAMVLFSISNTLLKVATDKYNLLEKVSPFAPALVAGIVAFIAVALYLANQNALPRELLYIVAAVIVVTVLGIAAFLASLQQGKVAAVTAILGLSTVIVAIITNQLFGVQFTLKEVAAMIMAVASIALFVL